MLKEGIGVSDLERPTTAPPGDIPSTWGFHLLQELRRMEDKMDAKIDGLSAKVDAVDTRLSAKIDAVDSKLSAKLDAVEAKLDAKIDAVEAKLDTKIDGLRYWSWGTIIAVIVAAITTILTLHA